MAKGNFQNYPPADLSEEEIDKIQSLEKQLSNELNRDIIVLAYEDKTH